MAKRRSRSEFTRALRAAAPRAKRHGTWVYVPYDQLSDELGPLASTPPEALGIVLVESVAKARRRPYHQQKLALILANQRQFALEQSQRGVAVEYVVTEGEVGDALAPVAAARGPLKVMRPAERELRHDLRHLVADGSVVEVPHEGWLTSRDEFEEGAGSDPPWRMDRFYRHVRRSQDVLMEDGKPRGGRFSFDGENRKPWSGEPEPPRAPRFRPDAITQEVGALVVRRFADHPGSVDLGALPATRANARRMWSWARKACLPTFGPYEDAMTRHHRGLFHTRMAALVNILRVLPRTVLTDALAADVPLGSKEGFVRQVLGWREFVRHVHEATDGFRRLPGMDVPLVDDRPAPSYLDAHDALPPVFWGTPSGLACLDSVVDDVWAEAWSHHIPRLMVLSNLATLLDVEPRELTDWFWVAYQDAFDWVVEPNVLGMGTFAAGDLMTTKPYVSGAPYLDRMSDYCEDCAFDPKRTCPITPLYWAFLARHRDRLDGNQRLRMPLASLAKRTAERRERDALVFATVRKVLGEGRVLGPADLDPSSSVQP